MIVLGLSVGVTACGAARPAAAPPAAGGSVLTAPGASTAERITALQAAVRAHPGDAEPLATLGLAYYQRVRETGDFSYYVRAETALRRARGLDLDNPDAGVGLATVALARHDFRTGLREARAAHRLAPQTLQAYPGIVDGLVELGRYRAAVRESQRFVDLRPALPSYARVSYLRELYGDLPGAVEAMRFAVSAGGEAPETVAYVQSLLGDLEFLRGRPAAARLAYRTALARMPKYVPAEFGLAQVDAAAGRLAPAIAGLRAIVDRLPLPQYVTVLGETELAAGRPAAAHADFAIIGAEQRLLQSSGVNTDAEVAVYEASHGNPSKGIGLGRRAWAAAPSIRSADALGWALTQAGRPQAGLTWARRSLKLGSRDPMLLYHAGVAALRSGRDAEARSHLARALSLNPRFSAYYAPRARQALAEAR